MSLYNVYKPGTGEEKVYVTHRVVKPCPQLLLPA